MSLGIKDKRGDFEMNFIFSVSHLMKACEVKELCKEMRENKHILAKNENQIKSIFESKKEKAAS